MRGMEAEENQISVWVCREEKVVSGLSRRTTCADVLRVLLEGHSGPGRAYCLVEKWRGFERVLPNKTKLLRLWSAWGEEQGNVRFVLVRQDASLASSAPRSAEARLVPSRQSPRQQGTVREATMALSPDKQRRVVRKAFRKLERINRKRARALSKDAERMETLVHLVVSQDHTIRQQVARIQELDREIELCEARVHLDRVRTHGVNYVQETYMVEAENQARPLRRVQQDTLGQLEEYAQMCEEVVRLQEELTEREVLLDSITRDIQEELNQRWMARRQEPDTENDGGGQGSALNGRQLQLHEDELILEEERIKTQLDTSLYIGLRLNTDLETVKDDLDLAQNIWGTREQELRDLQEELAEREVLLDSINRNVQGELNQRWMRRRQEPGVARHGGQGSALDGRQLQSHEDGLILEEERIKTQLDTSLYIGSRLNTDLEAVKGNLDLAQNIWGAREQELRDLLEKVDSLDLEVEQEETCDRLKENHGADEEGTSFPNVDTHGVWVEQARGLGCSTKTCNSTDDDSDTGLSSMHSQDSDVTPVYESLV